MKIKETISASGISRKELFRETSLDKFMFSKIENGKVLPTARDLRQICIKLACEPLDLYEKREIDLIGCMAEETPGKERKQDSHTRRAKRTFRLDTGVATRLTDDVLRACGYRTWQEWFDRCVDALLKEYETRRDKPCGRQTAKVRRWR